MRWEFIDPPSREDEQRRRVALEGIDRWWTEFRARSEAIHACFTQGAAFDLPAFMKETLQAVDPRLMWEFGPGLVKGGHRLVITPESHKSLRPMVRTLLERAPELDRWEFYGYRLPEPHRYRDMIEARSQIKVDDLRGRAVVGENHRLDLAFFSPQVGDQERLWSAAFVATETLFGEEFLDTWVGEIKASEDEAGAWLSIPELLADAKRLQEGVIANLSERPCYALTDDAKWTLFKLKPKQRDDYPNQSDLYVGKSPLVEMWKTAHTGVPFSSSRFSRSGETFCYLKLDGCHGSAEETFADKSEIEDALDELLIPETLGCQVGGGTGLRYSYIDLALTDVARAIPLLQERLRAGGVPNRSWLLFFDDVWQDEWVGIWDDTPPPPRWASRG